MISGHGPLSAPAILIADGGSDSDVKSGYAISGDAERILRACCGAAGIHYDELYRTCLIKEKINQKDWKENKDLVTDEYRRILTDEIRTIKPNVIIPIGELSFNFTTGLQGIRKFRGSILQATNEIGNGETRRVIPSLGPNPYIYEDPKLEFITRIDFTKIKRNLYETTPIKEVGNCWIAKTALQLRTFFERAYNSASFLIFDIETFCDIPTCISFCFDGQESVCAPILDRQMSLDERVLMLHLVSKMLASPIPKGNQNVKFDWRKLERFGIRVNNVIHDTMLAASCLYPEFPKNLGFLTSIYTDMPYFKDEGKEFDPAKYNRDQLYIYNAKDSLATHQVMQAQIEEMKEAGTETVYKSLITILPIYKEMEENGILVDDTQRKILLAKYENLFETYLYKFQSLVGRSANPLSSVQMQKLVYEELRFKKVRGIGTNKSGSFKADEDSLELLMWMSESEASPISGKEILRTIIDCRKLHKVLELLVLPLHPDGRMRTEFNLAGAETGRTTAGETTDYYLIFKNNKVKLINLGHSFQTIGKHGFTVDGETYGKDIRSMFVPTPGYSFVENDLAGAEALVDTVLAKDYDMLPYFKNPGIHKLTGSWVYNCEPSEIKKGMVLDAKGVGIDRYNVAKLVRHAAERNIKDQGLMVSIHQPLLECAKLLKVVHGKQPNLREVFHHDVREAVQHEKCLVAPNGRKRDFFGRFNEHTVNEGISYLPQAIVTDYIKQALPSIHSQSRDFYRPIAEAHDGFLAEVKIGKEIEYARIFKTTVEVPIDFRTCSLPRDFSLTIPCEASMSTESWQEMEDLKI